MAESAWKANLHSARSEGLFELSNVSREREERKRKTEKPKR